MIIPKFEETDKIKFVYHNFEENKEIEGKLMDIEQGVYGLQYRIMTKEDKIVYIGTYTLLKDRIPLDAKGKFIKIVYLGEKISPTTHKTYKDFEVYIKE